MGGKGQQGQEVEPPTLSAYALLLRRRRSLAGAVNAHPLIRDEDVARVRDLATGNLGGRRYWVAGAARCERTERQDCEELLHGETP